MLPAIAASDLKSSATDMHIPGCWHIWGRPTERLRWWKRSRRPPSPPRCRIAVTCQHLLDKRSAEHYCRHCRNCDAQRDFGRHL